MQDGQNVGDPELEAGMRAIQKLIEEHRRTGEPMPWSSRLSLTSFNG